MLVLSRQEDEQVYIGSGDKRVVITVIEIRGDKIRLGFDGPAEIPIHRREVAERIEREGRKSA